MPDQLYADITRDEWLDLVNKAESDGLQAMDERSRLQVLTGAVKAYLMSVRSTARRIEAEDGGGTADVTEVYSRDERRLFLKLSAREQYSKGALTEWSDLLYPDDGSDMVVRTFVDLGERSLETWRSLDRGETWSCELQEDARLSFGDALYYTDIAAMLYGDPVRTDSFMGREVVVIRPTSGQEVWVDVKTLFPVFYVFTEDPDGVPKRSVKLLAINPGLAIDRPSRTTCN